MPDCDYSRYDNRVIIKFLNDSKRSPKEIHVQMVKVMGKENSVSIQTVRKWVREFNAGRSECFDVQRPGRPAVVSNDDDDDDAGWSKSKSKSWGRKTLSLFRQ